MPYFHISTGLRGGYMPDSSYVLKAETRREIKAAIAYEAENIREAEMGEMTGLSKKAVAHIAAAAWRERKNPRHYLPFCLGYGRRDQSAPYGIFVGNATRAEYLQHLEEEN